MGLITLRNVAVLGCIFALTGTLAACNNGGSSAGGVAAPDVPAVTVVTVGKKPIAPSADFVGKTEADQSVDIRARVTGFLIAKNFTDGGMVEKDQILFKIDPAEYQASVASAQASLDRAQATLTQQEKQLARTRELTSKGTLSQSELDSAVSAESGAKADVATAEANLTTAQLNLGYTEIRSPIDGRIGGSSVDVGNLINENSGTLATVVDLDPIRVSFSITEKRYLDVMEAVNSGKMPGLVPKIRLANGEIFDQTGKIAYVDNQVDPNTGTVRVYLDFPNPDRLLLPGQFVDVILTSASPEEQIVIPQAAVQVNQVGPFVLVVNQDSKVEIRQITTGERTGTEIVVTKGLSGGEQIVVDGIQKVRPGGAVTVVEASATAGT